MAAIANKNPGESERAPRHGGAFGHFRHAGRSQQGLARRLLRCAPDYLIRRYGELLPGESYK
jgi:hypothetical protein